jgi:hypothetical protein
MVQINIVTSTNEDGAQEFQVQLQSGHQYFSVGVPRDVREEADWYADQLKHALGI